jgi:peptidoglycan/LPS O-acetylase OafA/YrhL
MVEVLMDQRAAQNIPYLDGWRGLAILCLLVGHFFPVSGINFGAAGVNLFFVLSGFLMARILFLRPVPIPVFYKRRFARVFPSVYFFVPAIIAAYAALGMRLDWRETAAAASFTINYFPGPPAGAVMPFGHIWSLCVEEHSYVILSLVALAHRAGWLRARTAVGLLALAWAGSGLYYWLTYPRAHVAFERWLHTEVAAFGIFASAYLLLRLDGVAIRRLPLLAFAALAVLGFGVHWWSVPLPVTTVVGMGAFALVVNLLHAAPRLVHLALSVAPLRQLGLWSFSLYLWQQPFYLQVRHHGMHPLVGTGLALGAGVASYYLLEKPARTWLNRRWGAPDRKQVEPVEETLAAYGEEGTVASPTPAPVAPPLCPAASLETPALK